LIAVARQSTKSKKNYSNVDLVSRSLALELISEPFKAALLLDGVLRAQHLPSHNLFAVTIDDSVAPTHFKKKFSYFYLAIVAFDDA